MAKQRQNRCVDVPHHHAVGALFQLRRQIQQQFFIRSFQNRADNLGGWLCEGAPVGPFHDFPMMGHQRHAPSISKNQRQITTGGRRSTNQPVQTLRRRCCILHRPVAGRNDSPLIVEQTIALFTGSKVCEGVEKSKVRIGIDLRTALYRVPRFDIHVIAANDTHTNVLNEACESGGK